MSTPVRRTGNAGNLVFRLRLGPWALAIGAAVLAGPPNAVADSSTITGVSVSKQFFNPSLGQSIGISFSVGDSGSLSVLVLDRDGYLVRKLASEKAVEKGTETLEWDGRDDAGELVADEAYSLKIDFSSRSGAASYFPANLTPQGLDPRPAAYDRLSGTVSYKLPGPARVHIQAGSARIDKKTGRAQGPVLKTIANREPRAGGPVIETWNGWDESGTFRVCDLPFFAIAVAGTPLPENSMITVGNRTVAFFDWVGKRHGESLVSASAAGHAHHRGLQSTDDVAPKLQLKPRNASWSAAERLWLATEESIEVMASVEGPTAKGFASHPGKLMIFLDSKNVRTLPTSAADRSIRVSVGHLPSGLHRLTVNWVSDYGPVAVNSVLFQVGATETAKTASK